MSVIWGLNMPLRQRAGLIILLGVSLFTMVMSIMKTISLQRIADQQSDPTATDVLYNASLSILWTCLEQACVIVMGCVPPLRAVMKLEGTKRFASSLGSLLRRAKTSVGSSRSGEKRSNKSGGSGGSKGQDGPGGSGLEMRSDKFGSGNGGGRGLGVPGAGPGEGLPYGESQQDLVREGDALYYTTELGVPPYSGRPSRGSDSMV